MNSINNVGQQPRLCIDLNVEYRPEDDDALNGNRVGESGTPPAETQEAGHSISQLRVISDLAQTSFSMRRSAPQAQTSLRAPRAQAIDAGEIVVSIENANPRISVTSSLPSARSSEVRWEHPGSQSSWLYFASSSFASSSNAGQSGETSEVRVPKNDPKDKKICPVPKDLRRPGETDETRIFRNTLLKRRDAKKIHPVPKDLRKPDETDETLISKKVLLNRRDSKKKYPVPKHLRKPGETDETRISRNALSGRRLVLIPEALRLEGETDQTRISKNVLLRRRLQRVPVPPEFRVRGETDATRIRYSTLKSRRKQVLIPEALREPGETENTKVARCILQNRKRNKRQSKAVLG